MWHIYTIPRSTLIYSLSSWIKKKVTKCSVCRLKCKLWLLHCTSYLLLQTNTTKLREQYPHVLRTKSINVVVHLT